MNLNIGNLKNRFSNTIKNKKRFVIIGTVIVAIIAIFLINLFLFEKNPISSILHPTAQIVLENKLEETQLDLTSCLIDNEELKSKVSNLESELSTTISQKDSLTSENTNLNENLNNCQSSLTKANEDYLLIQTYYGFLAENSAINICCKRKFDDPTIKYYYVNDNRIFCTSGYDETLKTLELICPSLT